MQQPKVSFVWGNHDMAWLGACLGDRALICQVLRISLRYRRLMQLEEGYGIPVEPLDLLARTVYANDPAVQFETKRTDMREKNVMARIAKTAGAMQLKLERQIIARHPEEHRGHR